MNHPLDEILLEFLSTSDAVAQRLDVTRTTLSCALFNDGKRLAAIRKGSDIGVGRLRAAILDLHKIAERGHLPPRSEWGGKRRKPA